MQTAVDFFPVIGLAEKMAKKYNAACISIDDVISNALKFDSGVTASQARQQCRQPGRATYNKQDGTCTLMVIHGYFLFRVLTIAFVIRLE